MQARYIQSGNVIDITAENAIAAGDIVIVGELAAVAKADITVGADGSLATVGTYDITKGDGVALAFDAGKSVFYDPATKKLAIAAGAGLIQIGKCANASSATDTLVRIILNV